MNLLPLFPNWSKPVSVEYAYKTDIITSRNGKEQRAAWRKDPRLTLSFTCNHFAPNEGDGVEALYTTIRTADILTTGDGLNVGGLGLPPDTDRLAVPDVALKPGEYVLEQFKNMAFPEWTMFTTGTTVRHFYSTDRLAGLGFQDGFFIASSGNAHYVYRDFHIDQIGVPAREVDRGGVTLTFGFNMIGVGSYNSGGGYVNLQMRAMPEAWIDYDPAKWEINPDNSAYDVAGYFTDTNVTPGQSRTTQIHLAPGSRYVRLAIKLTTTFPIYANSGVRSMYMTATWPRRAVADQPKAMVPGLTEMQDFFRAQGLGPFLVPEWSRVARLSAAISAGTTTVAVTGGVPVWAAAGDSVLIRYGFESEVVEVASAGPSAFEAVAPLAKAWPVGARVYPLHVGRLAANVTGKAQTTRFGEVALQIAADPGLSPAYAVSEAPMTFNGRELFLPSPDWKDGLDVSWEYFTETVDFEIGRVEHNNPVPFSATTIKADFVEFSAADVEALIGLYHRMKGRRGAFYMPTMTDDLSRAIGAAQGQRHLTVPDQRAYNLYRGLTTHRAVTVFFADGATQTNKVTDIELAGPNSHIYFADAWTQPVNKTTAKIICWTPLWRLAADTLTVEWTTDSVASLTLSFRMLEDLA